jgi:hypothetical protein
MIVFGIAFLISVGYWAYMMISNYKRLSEIKRLEKLLE